MGFHLQVSPSIQFLESNTGSVLCIKTLYDIDLFMDTLCLALPPLDNSSSITLAFHVSSMHANSRFYTRVLEYSYPYVLFFFFLAFSALTYWYVFCFYVFGAVQSLGISY